MEDRPRLAIISRLFPRPYRPQSGSFNLEQFRRLNEHYRISLLVPVPVYEWVRHRGELGATQVQGIDVRYSAWAFPPRVGRALYPACFGLSLAADLAWLRALDPACLLTAWAYPDAVGAMGLKLAGRLAAPMLIKAHGSDINVHAAGRLQARQLRWAVERSAGLITVSEALRRRAIELGAPAEKVVVVRNGVDGDLFSPMERADARAQAGLLDGRRAIVYVGSLLETKGTRELLDAFAALAPDEPHLDLLVIGEGPEAERLRQDAASAGLAERVRLLGRVAHDRLAPFFNAAELVCLPSYNEGLPNVLLEAMACGVPSVATRVGGIPEVITEETGLMVEARDPRALEAALREALRRKWDRDAIARHAAQFTWAANTEAMHALIDRAIATRGER